MWLIVASIMVPPGTQCPAWITGDPNI
jgi:hypothetical protein